MVEHELFLIADADKTNLRGQIKHTNNGEVTTLEISASDVNGILTKFERRIFFDLIPPFGRIQYIRNERSSILDSVLTRECKKCNIEAVSG